MVKVIGRLAELSADEEMRMIAEAREKAERDELARIQYAEEESMARGRAKGRAEGRAEVARQLLQMQLPLASIVKATGLSVEELERIAKEVTA